MNTSNNETNRHLISQTQLAVMLGTSCSCLQAWQKKGVIPRPSHLIGKGCYRKYYLPTEAQEIKKKMSRKIDD